MQEIAKRAEMREKLSPQLVLSGAIAHYLLSGLDELKDQEFDKEGKVYTGALKFLEQFKMVNGGVIPSPQELIHFKKLTHELANLQLYAIVAGWDKKRFLREFGGQYEAPLLHSASFALLISGYEKSLLENFAKIVRGEISYGFGGNVYRNPVINHLASDALMSPASNSIVRDLRDKFPDRQILLELGSGSGNFSKKFLLAYPDVRALVTDINPAVFETAGENLQNAGIEEERYEISVLDMKDEKGLEEIAKRVGDGRLIVHIGYILHEERHLAIDTLRALSNVFRGKDVVFAFSEYYEQDDITDSVPLHFQGLHYMTQDLFKRDEFIMTVSGGEFGFIPHVDGNSDPIESVHNSYINGEGQKVITNSTTYWKLK